MRCRVGTCCPASRARTGPSTSSGRPDSSERWTSGSLTAIGVGVVETATETRGRDRGGRLRGRGRAGRERRAPDQRQPNRPGRAGVSDPRESKRACRGAYVGSHPAQDTALAARRRSRRPGARALFPRAGTSARATLRGIGAWPAPRRCGSDGPARPGRPLSRTSSRRYAPTRATRRARPPRRRSSRPAARRTGRSRRSPAAGVRPSRRSGRCSAASASSTAVAGSTRPECATSLAAAVRRTSCASSAASAASRRTCRRSSRPATDRR